VVEIPGLHSVGAQIAQYGSGTVILAVGLTLLFGTLTGLYSTSTAEYLCAVIVAAVLVTAGATINVYGYKRECDFTTAQMNHAFKMEELLHAAGERSGEAGQEKRLPPPK